MEVGSLRIKLVDAQMPTERRPRGTSDEERVVSDTKGALVEAQHLEQQSRRLLSSARGEQMATQRALLLQIRRMQALEAMRLADIQVREVTSGRSVYCCG